MNEEDCAVGYEALNKWFGLSRSSWLTLPRIMMYKMPDKWRFQMAKLLNEWDERWPNMPDVTAQVTLKKNNKFIKTPRHLIEYRHPEVEDVHEINKMRWVNSNSKNGGVK